MTAAPLDQLWFTWTQHGTAGRAGYQVVAATPALLDPASRLRTKALELCRYRAPVGVRDPEDAPVSYGWIDDDGMRYVFYKTYQGTDDFGRPGNFAAHILVGPVTSLSADDLLTRFGSRKWWTGAPALNSELRAITLDDVEPAFTGEPEDPEPLVHALFAANRSRSVAFRRPPSEVVAIFGALAQRAPWLANDISFSSYESPDTAAHFDVVGVGVAGQTPPAALIVTEPLGDAEAGEAARIVLSRVPIDQVSTAIARSVVSPTDRGVDLRNLADCTIAFLLLLRDGVIDQPKLRAALVSERGVAELAKAERGVVALARAIAADDEVHWQALSVAARNIEAELGDAVSAELIFSADTIKLTSVLRCLARVAPALLLPVCVALCRRWAQSATRMHVDAPGAVEVLLGLRDHRLGVDQAVIDWLAECASRQPGIVATRTTIPAFTRGMVIACAVRNGVDKSELRKCLSTMPELGGPVAKYLQHPELLRGLVEVVDPSSVPTFAAWVVSELKPEPAYDFLAPLAAACGAADRLRLIATCLPTAPGHFSQRWHGVVRPALEDVVAGSLDTMTPWSLSEEVRQLVTSVPCGPLGEVFAGRPSVQLTSLAAELELTLLLPRHPAPDEVSKVVDRLVRALSGDVVARALVRAARRQHPPGPAAGRVLLQLVRMIGADHLHTWRGVLRGQLGPDAWDLAKECGQRDWQACEAEARKFGGAAEKWLDRVRDGRRRWLVVVQSRV